MPRRARSSCKAQPGQLPLAGFQAAINVMTRECEQQAKTLRALFARNGYDLAAGDLLYHAPGMRIAVPPQYTAQVRVNQSLEPGTTRFMKNPRFSLF